MKKYSSRATADDVLQGHDYKGKNAIITGANSGIGFETAKALAKIGTHIVMACRSKEKANQAIAQIKNEIPNASLEFRPLDLASFQSIENFANQINFDKIDILINNAGIITSKFQVTPQGHEMTAGVNHFGHFYLTKLLLPKLKESKSRVVVLSSESHKQAFSLDLTKWPQNEKDYGFNSSYAKSKLANILFADELGRRYQELTVASCHPGNMVTTNFGSDTAFINLLFKVISPFTKSPAQGASTSVYCVSQPDKIVSGNYFSGNKKINKSGLAKKESLAKELWEFSEKEVAKYQAKN